MRLDQNHAPAGSDSRSASGSSAPGTDSGFQARTHPKEAPGFSYEQAFSRNIGILSGTDQDRLRKSRVALAGLGGVGGVYAEALARMGVGRFSIADGDAFEWANFNRQLGGTLASVGRNKARTLEQRIHAINPEARVEVWEEHLDTRNIAEFLLEADVVVDAIEAFAIAPHRLLHRESRARGLPAILAAPLGFSAALLLFGREGSMSADEYFDWRDGQEPWEQVANLFLGLAPAGLHLGNLDLRSVDLERHIGPSNIAACLLCAGVVATETARLLLNRPGARFVPNYLQFDAYSQRVSRGRLRRGNRGWTQRLRRWVLLRRYRKIHQGRLAAGA